MKIFWSWQSDTPGKIGRFFVRDALQEAIEQMKQAPEIEEPTARETRDALHLDSDIQGTTGSPDLARTILDKIDASAVVIADITLVGSVPDLKDPSGSDVPGKKLINSNVAIELGYALCKLTDKNVVMVFNGHYGSHEDLPFDLRHKGGSIKFTLSPDAHRKRIEEERKKPKDRFVQALKPYLENRLCRPNHSCKRSQRSPRPLIFQRVRVLAKVDEIGYSYSKKSLGYIRPIPVSPLRKPLRLAALAQVVQRVPLLKEQRILSAQNEHGAIGFCPENFPPRGPAGLKASTQLFENGEIWSIGSSVIMSERNGRPDWVSLPALACAVFEQSYYDALTSLVNFAEQQLSLKSPRRIELGVVGNRELYLYGVFQRPYYPAGPILKSEVTVDAVLHDSTRDRIDALLLEFFTRVYDTAGMQRPEGSFGFPPNRPTV